MGVTVMQYTVHRILSMIKTTKARIEKELSDESPKWVRVSRGQEDSIRGVAIKDIKRDIQSHYDRVMALIANYTKLKAAIIKSNAGIRNETELYKVSVGGQSLTVAEIIELNDTVYGGTKKYGFKSALLAKMKEDYSIAQVEFDDIQEKTDAEVNKYLQAISGKKKDDEETDSSTKSLIEATSKMLHEQKDPHLVDPLKIADKIVELENEIEDFRTEADAVLSEQNALTLVDVDLVEIK